MPSDVFEFRQALHRQVLLPILRMQDPALCQVLAEALHENGFPIFEITLDTPEALSLIQGLAKAGVWIGAGTVRNAAQAEAALAHGARFLVSPGLSPDVAWLAQTAGVPYLPGIFTASEAMQALDLGVGLLKLFPATVGPEYLRQMRGPFPEPAWLVTGGVEFESIPAWLAAGAWAVGYGHRLISPRTLASRDRATMADMLAAARERLDTWREAHPFK